MKYLSAYQYILPISVVVLAGCSAHNAAPVTALAPTAVSQPSSAMELSSSVADQKVSSGRLGTQWGENVSSSVTNVNAQRVTSQPTAMVSIYYNANSVSRYDTKSYSITLQNVNMSIQNKNGKEFKLASNYVTTNPMRVYYLKGKDGQRYQLYFYNNDPKQAYEVIATVDGIDVISGQKGSVKNSGYLIYPKQSLTIEGFRKSSSDVAAFRFSKPENSYAAHSVAGDVNNIGIIGVAVYPTTQNSTRSCGQQAFPQDNGYAPEPCNKN